MEGWPNWSDNVNISYVTQFAQIFIMTNDNGLASRWLTHSISSVQVIRWHVIQIGSIWKLTVRTHSHVRLWQLRAHAIHGVLLNFNIIQWYLMQCKRSMIIPRWLSSFVNDGLSLLYLPWVNHSYSGPHLDKFTLNLLACQFDVTENSFPLVCIYIYIDSIYWYICLPKYFTLLCIFHSDSFWYNHFVLPFAVALNHSQ